MTVSEQSSVKESFPQEPRCSDGRDEQRTSYSPAAPEFISLLSRVQSSACIEAISFGTRSYSCQTSTVPPNWTKAVEKALISTCSYVVKYFMQ